MQYAYSKCTDTVQLEGDAINVDHNEAGHKGLRKPSTISALSIEKTYQKFLNTLITVSLSLFEVITRSLAVKNVPSILQYPIFNVSLFKAQFESLQQYADNMKAIKRKEIKKIEFFDCKTASSNSL